MRKTSGPLKPVGKRYPRGNLATSSHRHLVQSSVTDTVTPQDGHLDPHSTIEVSRPKHSHTQHFTFGLLSFTVSSTNFLGKILLPTVLLGDPGGVKLGELAAITESCLLVASHWWSGVMSASQFKQLDFCDGTGVKTSGAGEGRPFTQGEIG